MVTAHSVRIGRAMPVRSAPAARPVAPLAPRTAVAAVAAWGCGLIAAALGAAGVLGAGAVSRVVGVALLALAAGALVWGAASLSRGRITVPRTATALALSVPVALAVAVAADPARSSVLGAAVGMVLAVVAGILAARTLRSDAQGRADAATAPARTARGGMAALLVAAAVTTAVVVPALGAVQDAQLKPGQITPMQMDMDMGGHGH